MIEQSNYNKNVVLEFVLEWSPYTLADLRGMDINEFWNVRERAEIKYQRATEKQES